MRHYNYKDHGGLLELIALAVLISAVYILVYGVVTLLGFVGKLLGI